jgi:hypothetical protein
VFRPKTKKTMMALTHHQSQSQKQKSRLQLRSVVTLPNDFPTGSLGKAKRMCKRPIYLLLTTATPCLYQKESTRVNTPQKIF